MKSGLEGRNNPEGCASYRGPTSCLNEVRPRRPEQYMGTKTEEAGFAVSMKSGLEGRNNRTGVRLVLVDDVVSMKSGLEGRNNQPGLGNAIDELYVSMKSGLEGRNNPKQFR